MSASRARGGSRDSRKERGGLSRRRLRRWFLVWARQARVEMVTALRWKALSTSWIRPGPGAVDSVYPIGYVRDRDPPDVDVCPVVRRPGGQTRPCAGPGSYSPPGTWQPGGPETGRGRRAGAPYPLRAGLSGLRGSSRCRVDGPADRRNQGDARARYPGGGETGPEPVRW